MTTSSTSPPSSASAAAQRLGSTPVLALWTGRAHGDLRGLDAVPPGLGVAPGSEVHRLHQVHGATVVAVGEPAPPGTTRFVRDPTGAPPDGDALVSATAPGALGVLVADCAAVALATPGGVCGAVHAGWRGVRSGVLEAAVAAVRALGGDEVLAGLGPCIGPCCYDFSDRGIDELSEACGQALRATTTWGTPSLDLPRAVRAVLGRSGVDVVAHVACCTGCNPAYYSHRRHADVARQALLVWRQR